VLRLACNSYTQNWSNNANITERWCDSISSDFLCLSSLYSVITQFFISSQPLFIKQFFDALKNTYETILAHTGKVKKKISFKQRKNEVCADCLDNSIKST